MRGILTWIPSLFLAISLILVSCADQPIDSGDGGTVRIDTTIVRTVDTVVINDTDTVIVTRVDTTFVTVRDTVKVEVTRRDTIRDTIERFRVDTIEVPVETNRKRFARLVVHGRDLSAGGNGAIDSFGVDISDWIQYRAVDSAGMLRGLGLTLSVGMPPRFREIDIGLGRSNSRYRLHGVAMFIPIFRPDFDINVADSFELEEHPYEVGLEDKREGGLLLSYSADGGDIRNVWTGNRFDVNGFPSTGEFRSRGTLTIWTVDRTRRIIGGTVQAVIFIPEERAGTLNVVPVELRIDFELEW